MIATAHGTDVGDSPPGSLRRAVLSPAVVGGRTFCHMSIVTEHDRCVMCGRDVPDGALHLLVNGEPTCVVVLVKLWRDAAGFVQASAEVQR